MLRDVPEPESVAAHMYRMSLMAFLFVDTVAPALNRERLMLLQGNSDFTPFYSKSSSSPPPPPLAGSTLHATVVDTTWSQDCHKIRIQVISCIKSSRDNHYSDVFACILNPDVFACIVNPPLGQFTQ